MILLVVQDGSAKSLKLWGLRGWGVVWVVFCTGQGKTRREKAAKAGKEVQEICGTLKVHQDQKPRCEKLRVVQ